MSPRGAGLGKISVSEWRVEGLTGDRYKTALVQRDFSTTSSLHPKQCAQTVDHSSVGHRHWSIEVPDHLASGPFKVKNSVPSRGVERDEQGNGRSVVEIVDR